MDVQITKDNGSCAVRVRDDLTVLGAAELKKTLLDALNDCAEMEIDLSEVREMDTAGFQLLVLAKREASMSQKGFRISSYSPAVTTVLELYNMAIYFTQ